jgi:hypothetical protein
LDGAAKPGVGPQLGYVIPQHLYQSFGTFTAPQTPAAPTQQVQAHQPQLLSPASLQPHPQPQVALPPNANSNPLQQPSQSQPQPQQQTLAKRVACVMQQLLDSSAGPLSMGQLMGVVGDLRTQGHPEALHLADVMISAPIGSGLSEPQRSALTSAVFKWQVASL